MTARRADGTQYSRSPRKPTQKRKHGPIESVAWPQLLNTSFQVFEGMSESMRGRSSTRGSNIPHGISSVHGRPSSVSYPRGTTIGTIPSVMGIKGPRSSLNPQIGFQVINQAVQFAQNIAAIPRRTIQRMLG